MNIIVSYLQVQDALDLEKQPAIFALRLFDPFAHQTAFNKITWDIKNNNNQQKS